MNTALSATVQQYNAPVKRFRAFYTLQKDGRDWGIRSFTLEGGEMSRERVYRELASQYARHPEDENRIFSQLRFVGMAAIGRGRGIKNVSFVETATPLPFPE